MTKENVPLLSQAHGVRLLTPEELEDKIDYLQFEEEQILLSELEEYIDIEAYIDECDRMLERSS